MSKKTEIKRGGRPAIAEANRRSRMIGVSLTEDEWKLFTHYAHNKFPSMTPAATAARKIILETIRAFLLEKKASKSIPTRRLDV